MRYKLYVLASVMLIASGAAASAQGTGMAPGSALPGNARLGGVNPGGVGPGMSLVAPGPSTGRMIENLGPGGIPLSIRSHDPSLRSLNRSAR
jgi:hypothetical protein